MRERQKLSWNLVRGAVLLALAFVCWLTMPDRLRALFEPAALAAPMTFIVNTTDDANDGACNAAHCSLREAITAANANVGADTINFNIPGPGVKTISPATFLPDLTEAVTIDGYSQPGASVNTLAAGSNAVLLVEIDGSQMSIGPLGLLVIRGGNSKVKGLVFNRSKNAGLAIASDNNEVQGNYLGTDPSGTVARANSGSGLSVNDSAFNLIGGTTPAVRNLISGNASGVQISSFSSNNSIQGNLIGTAADGITPLGNQSSGIFLFTKSFDNGIGLNVADGLNVIAFNGGQGILLNDSGTGNAIGINSIHSNGELGIDITPSGGGSGVTPNDALDGDTGSNKLQNFPIITSAVNSGLFTTVHGTLNSTPNTQFRIQAFSNRSCDPSGHGEGEGIHDSTTGTTNAAGDLSFTIIFPNSLPFVSPYITTVATDPAGNTSEFSRCVPALASTFIVNSTADTNDGACTAAANGCTLREAIAASNASLDYNQISFNIPGAGVRTINVLSALPTLTGVVIIDGYTQPNAKANTASSGNNSDILIELNGASAGDVDGLRLAGGNSTVRGLVINRFQQSAIRLATKGDNVIAGNYLGTDPNGTTTLANGNGISVSGPDNRLGGLDPADRNLFSGNTGAGVALSGPSTQGTLVMNNYIGVNAGGFGPLGNSQAGVFIQNASNNVVGGSIEGSRNVISSNGGDGVRIEGGEHNRLYGNFIGTRDGGVSPLGNGGSGISLENSDNNIIGGLKSDDEPNLVAANGQAGISLISSANNNHIEGNFIGTNESGGVTLGNTGDGILVRFGNANQITLNSIANNGGLGINLDGGVTPADGVTPNDPGDPDTGPNGLQNFPVLTSAVRNGNNATVEGTLNSTPNTTFRVEYFGSPSCDPTNGEGQRSLSVRNHTTDSGGNVAMSDSVFATSLSDQFITATATDPAGNTSEFSRCIPIFATAPTPTPTPTPSPSPTPTPTPTPSPTPTPVTLQFGQAVYSVIEDCTEVILSVSRTGDASLAASVDYLAQPGTATDRSDFTTALGTLNFPPGVTAVSFVVLVHEDSFAEGTETATVVLSNPIGATLGQQSTATLEILDDPPEPSTNANDISEQFVCQHYHDFLNRMPDVGGLNFWTNQIEQCGLDVGCLQAMRVNVSAAFFLSIEFQETSFFVIRAQRIAFGKMSDSAATRMTYLQFIRDARQVGEDVVVGMPGWEQKLEANRNAYAEKIVESTEFTTKYPLSMTAGQYVDALFGSAGVTPAGAETQDAVAGFGGGGTAGRIAALRKVVDSTSVRNAEFRGAFVLMQYFGYLRRNPTDAPDFNDAGYQFWLAKLNQFGGDFVRAEMVKAFISSIEYRQRFGAP